MVDTQKQVETLVDNANEEYRKLKQFAADIKELAFGDNAENKGYTSKDVIEKLKELSDKALHLDKMISGEVFTENYGIIFGSSVFLYDYLNDELLDGNSDVCDKFVESNAWEPFESMSCDALYKEMDTLGYTHKIAIKNLAELWDNNN